MINLKSISTLFKLPRQWLNLSNQLKYTTTELLYKNKYTDGPEHHSITDDYGAFQKDVKQYGSNFEEFDPTVEGQSHFIKETYKQYKEHESKKTYNFIKRKYYREKQEKSLLTYSMVQQIKTLYTNDPNYWTAERISLHFPVSSQNAMKAAKSRLYLPSNEEILKYDSKILNRWKQIAKGKLGNPKLLEAYINNKSKTSNKSLTTLNDDQYIKDIRFEKSQSIYIPNEEDHKNKLHKVKKRRTVNFKFRDIIENYENKTNRQDIKKLQESNFSENSVLRSKLKPSTHKKLMTFEDYIHNK